VIAVTIADVAAAPKTRTTCKVAAVLAVVPQTNRESGKIATMTYPTTI
jgi:hypothetical protein